MYFEGKGYVFVGSEEFKKKDGRSFKIVKFFDPDSFEVFEMFVPEGQGIILPKEKSKVDVYIKPTIWNGKTSFRLVDVKAV